MEQQLTSDDVIFTVQSIQDPDAKSPLFQSWQGVTVNRVSELEVQLHPHQSLRIFCQKPKRSLYFAEAFFASTLQAIGIFRITISSPSEAGHTNSLHIIKIPMASFLRTAFRRGMALTNQNHSSKISTLSFLLMRTRSCKVLITDKSRGSAMLPQKISLL